MIQISRYIIIEWIFPLWVRFLVQYSLLLQYKILDKLVTYIRPRYWHIKLFLFCESLYIWINSNRPSKNKLAKCLLYRGSVSCNKKGLHWQFLFYRVGAGIPNMFGIQTVALCSVFQLCFVLNKMVGILSKTIGNQKTMAAILFGFLRVGFGMVRP